MTTTELVHFVIEGGIGLLGALGAWLLTGLKDGIGEVKNDTKEIRTVLDNHSQRLTRVEVILEETPHGLSSRKSRKR